MSYEHCDAHDMDATNGCPKCEAIDRVAEARERVEDLAREIASAELPMSDITLALALAYLRGTTAHGSVFNDWEAYVPDVVEGLLK